MGPGFFQTLGVNARLGRTLTDADSATGAPNVVMLSYSVWQSRFAGDPEVLGRKIHLDEQPFEVVGVLPRGFVGPMGDADFWLALDIGPTHADRVAQRSASLSDRAGVPSPGLCCGRAPSGWRPG